jgi:hypothetical protein
MWMADERSVGCVRLALVQQGFQLAGRAPQKERSEFSRHAFVVSLIVFLRSVHSAAEPQPKLAADFREMHADQKRLGRESTRMDANLTTKPKFTTETPATARRLRTRRNAQAIKAKPNQNPEH